MATRNTTGHHVYRRGFSKSVLYLSMLSAMGLAYAQETPDKQKEAEAKATEVIEVRGIRASAAENLAIKRLSIATRRLPGAGQYRASPDPRAICQPAH